MLADAARWPEPDCRPWVTRPALHDRRDLGCHGVARSSDAMVMGDPDEVSSRRLTYPSKLRDCPMKKSVSLLVTDLDNTLWGGVLGEDGVAGLALGEDSPGSVYKSFQRVLRS